VSRGSHYRVQCDSCGKSVSFEIGRTLGKKSKVCHVIDSMREGGWTFGKWDTCPNCHKREKEEKSRQWEEKHMPRKSLDSPKNKI
jgi:hypothetical protein